MIEEHKKLLLPTVIRGVIYGIVIAILLVNITSLLGVRLSSEVYAEKMTEMEAESAMERFYPEGSRCEF